MKNLENIGIDVPALLLPNEKVNLSKWAVVACDQYTSQPDYWKKAEEIVGSEPSTLRLIFPEVYLEDGDEEERIKAINRAMVEYVTGGVLMPQPPAMVYIDRKTSHAASRKGLILCVDLEKYDYSKGSQSLIRATEGTVIERLPPRIRVRENASVELPHIMVLIDDPGKTVIEPLAEQADKLEKLYDFELMLEGGHIKGYKVENAETLNKVASALEKLADEEAFRKKYNVGTEKGVLLFAVGDGNHSLATAKACWESIKKNLADGECKQHPARYALVEVVNVHDAGLQFEPIHRVVFNVNAVDLLDNMVKYWTEKGCQAYYKIFESPEAIKEEKEKLACKHCHLIPFSFGKNLGAMVIDCPKFNLEVGTLQSFLDEYSKTAPEMRIDYIHGDEVVAKLSTEERNIGFYLPAMNKHDLFKTVILDGVLPRKTFSMGEAEEKRFYMECRMITAD